MLNIDSLFFSYKQNKPVLENISLTIKGGEHVSIMGESGCGKSTLLKLIYGLLDVDKGSISWNDTPITGPKDNLVPGFEAFKYVAQDFDLMPYTSVSENIKKHLSRFYPEEAAIRTQELLEVIELEKFADTKVKNLSGGQQQRVAIARALAKEPKLLLLDEPFGQIDNFRKNTLRRKLFQYLKKQHVACVVATHDKNDALSFADRLVVLQNKKIIANDSPLKIYHNPKQRYVAALFDDVNELEINGEQKLIYPHQLKVITKANGKTKPGEVGGFILKAKVTNAYFKGSYWLIEAKIEDQNVFFNHYSKLKTNTKITLSFIEFLES